MAASLEAAKTLQPGHKIVYKETYAYAIFSGKLGSYGLTVAHIAKGKSNELHDASDENAIAEILETIQGTIKTSDDEFTADVAFLKMNSSCVIKNILHCPNGMTLGEYQLDLYKGRISVGEPVMVVDEQGCMKQGTIRSTRFNNKDEETGIEVRNALSIVDENNRAIAQHGQSGSLVTSLPQQGSKFLRVYGIVTHIHKEKYTAASATIANRLWDVLKAFAESEPENPNVRLGDSLESIDFAKD